MQIRFPLHVLYALYKRQGGWYPSIFGGWTRNMQHIIVYEHETEAAIKCPVDCEIIRVAVTFITLDNLCKLK